MRRLRQRRGKGEIDSVIGGDNLLFDVLLAGIIGIFYSVEYNNDTENFKKNSSFDIYVRMLG
jgi:hypothetical protein